MRTIPILFAMAVLFATGAHAASQRDWDNCTGDDTDLKIAGCTAVLEDAGESPEKRATAFFNRGYAHAENGDTDSAIADYGQAIELDPENPDTYNERGDAWYDKGELDRAIADYGEAIRLNPEDATGYDNRGVAYNDKGDYDSAIADFGRAIDLDPDDAAAHNGRGDAYSEKGDYERAIADYSEAIRAEPEGAAAYTNRGLAYIETGNTAGAEADFRAALAAPQGEEVDEWALSTAKKELAALESAPAQQQPAAPASRRVALVIGNSDYEAAPTLPNPVRDAGAVADSLRKVGFSEVIVADDLTKSAMERALIDFSDKAQGADWAVIYYAGHGMEFDGRNYLIPVDARLTQDRHVGLETVPLDVLLDAASGAKLRFVILDACRNNPFLAHMTRAFATRAISQGLAKVEPSEGTLVAYSARAGQVAIDGGGEHSPFVQALLEHIGEPGLDVRRMFAKVRESVRAATDNVQEPYAYDSLPSDQLSFAPAK
jgi:tetratricopeptide (TPR) repeat protein